jgi:hypothetical protein
MFLVDESISRDHVMKKRCVPASRVVREFPKIQGSLVVALGRLEEAPVVEKGLKSRLEGGGGEQGGKKQRERGRG